MTSWVRICVAGLLLSTNAVADGPFFAGGDVGRNPVDRTPLNPESATQEGLLELKSLGADQLRDAISSLEALRGQSPVYGALAKQMSAVLASRGAGSVVVPEITMNGWQVKMSRKDDGLPRPPAPTLSPGTQALDTGVWVNDAEKRYTNFWIVRNPTPPAPTRSAYDRTALYDTRTGRKIDDSTAYTAQVGEGHSFDNELANTDDSMAGLVPR